MVPIGRITIFFIVLSQVYLTFPNRSLQLFCHFTWALHSLPTAGSSYTLQPPTAGTAIGSCFSVYPGSILNRSFDASSLALYVIWGIRLVSWKNMFLTSAIPNLFSVVDAGQINFRRVYELSQNNLPLIIQSLLPIISVLQYGRKVETVKCSRKKCSTHYMRLHLLDELWKCKAKAKIWGDWDGNKKKMK